MSFLLSGFCFYLFSYLFSFFDYHSFFYRTNSPIPFNCRAAGKVRPTAHAAFACFLIRTNGWTQGVLANTLKPTWQVSTAGKCKLATVSPKERDGY